MTDKLTKPTNFKLGIDRIFPDNDICSNKAKELANFLVPKIMYIPFTQIVEIKERLSCFERICEQNNDDLPLLYLVQAFLTYRQGQYKQALLGIRRYEYMKQSFKDDFTQACYSAIKGACYRSLGQKESALSAFHFTIRHFHYRPTQAFASYLYHLSLYHIAEINAELGNYKIMLKQHEKFFELSEAEKNVDMINRALNGIGRAYLGLGDFDNCLTYLQRAEKKSSKAGNIPFIAKNQHDIGIVFFKMKRYDNALLYLNKALKIREAYKLNDAAISSYILVSKVYIAQRNFESAVSSLNKGKAIAEKLKVVKKLCEIYKVLSIAHEENDNYDLALLYYKKFHTLNEKINDVKSTQIENERVRETNTKLNQQKNIISNQKTKIEAYASRLIETNMHLQNFASIAAHDLKAPLRITNNFIGLLSRKYEDNLDNADKEYVNFITKNMSSLSKMIDDLLSLSKLDQDLPPMKTVNTAILLDEILNRLQNKIKDIQPDILIQNDIPNVVGHESLIGQVFQNLIDNTLKYRSNSKLRIQILHSRTKDSDDEEYVTFEIKDNGVGIPDCLQNKIFELFSGANGENSNGIGLATCKKIVSNYGGTIWVESQEGIGTSMFFTLPLCNRIQAV